MGKTRNLFGFMHPPPPLTPPPPPSPLPTVFMVIFVSVGVTLREAEVMVFRNETILLDCGA
jgi:hypothetical protein